MVYQIALIGGAAAGKSSVAAAFRALGALVLDADEINRKLLTESRVRDIIGKQLSFSWSTNFRGDCARLGELIFGDWVAKKWLECFLHPLILEKMELSITKIGKDLTYDKPYLLLEIPLFLEAGWLTCFKIKSILLVECMVEVQRARLKRRGYSEDRIEAILQTQSKRKNRWRVATETIFNQGSLEALRDKVRFLDILYQA